MIHLVAVPEFGSAWVDTFGRARYRAYLERHAALLKEQQIETFAFFGTRLKPPSVVETLTGDDPWGERDV